MVVVVLAVVLVLMVVMAIMIFILWCLRMVVVFLMFVVVLAGWPGRGKWRSSRSCVTIGNTRPEHIQSINRQEV